MMRNSVLNMAGLKTVTRKSLMLISSTSVRGHYPELAILKPEDAHQETCTILEIESTLIDEQLRPTEVAKITCGKKYFAAISIDDYAKSSPKDWRL